MDFSPELRERVMTGDIRLSFRLWQRPRVKVGGRYRVGPGLIEVEAVDLVPFAVIADDDVEAAGEPDREALRRRAAHAGPITEDTMLYRIRFHPVRDFHPLEEERPAPKAPRPRSRRDRRGRPEATRDRSGSGPSGDPAAGDGPVG